MTALCRPTRKLSTAGAPSPWNHGTALVGNQFIQRSVYDCITKDESLSAKLQLVVTPLSLVFCSAAYVF